MMQSNNPFQSFRENMRNMIENRDTRFSSHKKHMEALSEAQKTAMDMVKSISNMQQQYMKQAFDNASTMMRDMMSQGTSTVSWAKQGEHIKNHMTQSIDHGVNLAEMLGKSHKEICDSMKQSVEEQARKTVRKSTKVN